MLALLQWLGMRIDLDGESREGADDPDVIDVRRRRLYDEPMFFEPGLLFEMITDNRRGHF